MFANKGKQKITSLKDIPGLQPPSVPAPSPALVIATQPSPTAISPVSVVQIPYTVIHQSISHTYNNIETTAKPNLDMSKLEAILEKQRVDNLAMTSTIDKKANEEVLRLASESEVRAKAIESKHTSEIEAIKEQGSSEIESLKAQLAFIQIEFNEIKNRQQSSSGSHGRPNDGSKALIEGDALSLLLSPSPTSHPTSPVPGESQKTSPRVGKGNNEWVDVSAETEIGDNKTKIT